MTVLAWLASPIGRWVAAGVALLAALAWLRWDAGRDAAANAERAVIERNMEARDDADREAAGFRGDGAVRRLRDGAF